MLFMRRLRGIVVTAITWAIPWSVLGAGAAVAVELLWRSPEHRELFGAGYTWGLFLVGLRLFGIVGAVSGALFAAGVALGERRFTFGSLRTGRVLLWGALGGAAIPLLVGVGSLISGAPGMLRQLTISGIGACLGAGCAWATLALARRAREPSEPRSPAELGSGARWESVDALGADRVRRGAT